MQRLQRKSSNLYRYLGHLELCHTLVTHSMHLAFDLTPTFLEFGHDGRLPWNLAHAGLQLKMGIKNFYR